MLKTLDMLIGVTTVILLFSVVVTAVTQFVTGALNSRGRQLKSGLADLLRQVDPSITAPFADQIMHAVLTHPLIAESQQQLGSVIHREELTKLLMALAAGEGTQSLDAAARTALQRALANNGVSDPAAVLSNVRSLALYLERTNPELSNDARVNIAILQEAGSAFVAKIHAWFDQTIDRVSARFTTHARIVTFAAALVVAIAVQLDAVALINRLSIDDSLREALVDRATLVVNENPTNGPASADYQQLLATKGLVVLPGGGWLRSWTLHEIPGIVIATLLMSLGAPFWYNALKNLLQLRSTIAQKDDAQRTARQTTQGRSTEDPAPAPPAPAVLRGERGDLTAVG